MDTKLKIVSILLLITLISGCVQKSEIKESFLTLENPEEISNILDKNEEHYTSLEIEHIGPVKRGEGSVIDIGEGIGFSYFYSGRYKQNTSISLSIQILGYEEAKYAKNIFKKASPTDLLTNNIMVRPTTNCSLPPKWVTIQGQDVMKFTNCDDNNFVYIVCRGKYIIFIISESEEYGELAMTDAINLFITIKQDFVIAKLVSVTGGDFVESGGYYEGMLKLGDTKTNEEYSIFACSKDWSWVEEGNCYKFSPFAVNKNIEQHKYSTELSGCYVGLLEQVSS